ncbi:MAG TPA: TetR-like C-terminal domain-containing protein [Mycobacteriales bacterium]|nr:TetR-like C-terminal domain-containing protein [Mycobacteriales bacterium]
MRERPGSYHHGDLATALLDAATALARAGGPQAVVLREAARSVGVSATAAYRHFANRDDLEAAVKQRALDELAATMRAALKALTPTGDPVTDAEARLHATGMAYIDFALSEPGLFRVAFDNRGFAVHAKDDPAEDSAYGILGAALDGLVEVGRMPPERRPLADTAAWATVHGLASLLLDGPLRTLTDTERAAVIERATAMVLRGI